MRHDNSPGKKGRPDIFNHTSCNSDRRSFRSPIRGILYRNAIVPISSGLVFVSSIWVQGLLRIVAQTFDDTKPFRTSFAEEDAVTKGEVLWSLNEAERHQCSVTGADVCSVYIDDSTCLRNRTDV